MCISKSEIKLNLYINGILTGIYYTTVLTLWLPAVFGDEAVPGQRFAQSSLILNYCQNKLVKTNKYCFIPNERGIFLLSNCIKHHAMWTYVVGKLRMWKTHIPSHFTTFSAERWKKRVFATTLFISCFYRLPCRMCSGNVWTRSILITRKVTLHRFKR